jgi:hypothetical protein
MWSVPPALCNQCLKECVGARILSLTPTEQTKQRYTERKKQKRQYETKKKEKEVERKKRDLSQYLTRTFVR